MTTSLMKQAFRVIFTSCMVGFALPAFAAEQPITDVGTLDETSAKEAFPAKPPYSPYAGRNFPTRPFFGDTHVHTSFSMDAGAFGCRLAPADAYRFAKGEEVTASSGQRARLARPLDFIVVTDHSDGFGFFPQLLRGNADLLAYPQGRKWYDVINSGQGAAAAVEIIGSFTQETIAKGLLPVPGTLAYRGAWQETIKAADEANDPGHFTAFIGYEWTSTTGGNNLHRNVIFRQNGLWASQVEPVAALLMALATLSTAWCSFESAAWTRKSNRLMNEFNALERRAGLLTMQGMQQATIHTGMFMQALAAHQAGNDKLVNFYIERFPPELRKAYDAWLAEKPFENPNADPHPFVPNVYEMRGSREAADASAKAANSQQEAGSAGSISGQYLANTVLFATVLFFANASAKFEQRRVRVVAFAFAVVVFLFAVVRTAMLPL